MAGRVRDRRVGPGTEEHGARPAVRYGSIWALWLSTVPYGLWNKRIAASSMDEYAHSLARLEAVFQRALDHFGLTLREGTTVGRPRRSRSRAWSRACGSTSA